MFTPRMFYPKSFSWTEVEELASIPFVVVSTEEEEKKIALTHTSDYKSLKKSKLGRPKKAENADS